MYTIVDTVDEVTYRLTPTVTYEEPGRLWPGSGCKVCYNGCFSFSVKVSLIADTDYLLKLDI